MTRPGCASPAQPTDTLCQLLHRCLEATARRGWQGRLKVSSGSLEQPVLQGGRRTIYFITSRMPIECGKAQRGHGKPFTFDLEDNASGQEFFCCRKTGKNAHVELGGNALLSALKNEPYRQVLLCLHGFSNLPDDNDPGIVKDYWDDQNRRPQRLRARADDAAIHGLAELGRIQPGRRPLPEAHQRAGPFDGQPRAAARQAGQAFSASARRLRPRGRGQALAGVPESTIHPLGARRAQPL